MNVQEMMKQAQVMQKRMQEMHEKLGQMEVEGQAGGGLVEVTMTCRGEVRRVVITPEALREGKETVEDLVMAAVNQARQNADNTLAEETKRMMQELGLPTNAGLPGF